jgi:hypothetical protein
MYIKTGRRGASNFYILKVIKFGHLSEERRKSAQGVRPRTGPKTSLNHLISSSDGRCVTVKVCNKGQGRNQRELMTRAHWEFLVHGKKLRASRHAWYSIVHH